MEILTDEEFRNSLLNYCEYYKGEGDEEWPEGVNFVAWNGERIFVERRNPKEIAERLDFFLDCMLVDLPKQFDKPIDLLASMFEYYYHAGQGMYSPDERAISFRERIKTIYKPKPSNK